MYKVTVTFLQIHCSLHVWHAAPSMHGAAPHAAWHAASQHNCATTFHTFPCQLPAGEVLAFKIASKAALAATFLSKEIQFPVNPLASCPKSRCNLISGASNTTVTNMLSGLPLFDLFSKMGVTMGLGANQLLTFDVAKLNKVRPAQPRSSLWQVHHCQLV
jgi:hypothetical protein